MEKTKVLCLILVMVLASAGTAGVLLGVSGGSTPPVVVEIEDTVMDKPVDGTPDDLSAIENLFIAQGELQRKGGFVGRSQGTSVSVGMAQNVTNNRVVINGNAFKEMITVGVVKKAYQLYIYNGNYLYRSANVKSADNIAWGDTASRYDKNGFLETFGHFSNALTGYILTEETVLSGVLENYDEANGLYTYRYVLDTVESTKRLINEMRTNSNMSGNFTFSKAEIVVTMDSDWQVKTLRTDCEYTVPLGVGCTEDITETFYDLESQDLPNKEFFEQFLDADIETPVEQKKDALTVLMNIFAPYIGTQNKLSVALTASNNGQNILNGLLSAKIDVDNLENIEVAAKFGDLYLEYAQGKVFVTYQDFKASTTVDGIMSVIGAFIPQTSGLEISADEILSKLTYTETEDKCVVNLPLTLGGVTLNVSICADVTEQGYEFTYANIVCGDLEVDFDNANGFTVPEHIGDYPEILGLLDLAKNGVIYGNVNAFGMDMDVLFDISELSLYAASGDLAITYLNDVVYAEYGAIKVKLNISDVDRIITLLRMIGLIDIDVSLDIPQISVGQILAALGNIDAVSTDNGVKFCLTYEDVEIELYLESGVNGWNVDKVIAVIDGNALTLAFGAPVQTEIPEIESEQYADVTELVAEFAEPIASLLTASSYGVAFTLDLNVNNAVYDVSGNFTYDANKNIRINAVVSNGAAALINANVTLADGVVYLDVNGIKAAFCLDESADFDFTQLLGKIDGLDGVTDGVMEKVDGIVNAVKNIDLNNIDFTKLIKQFSYVDGALAVTLDASFVNLGEIGIELSVNEYNCLTVAINGLALGSVSADAQATLNSNVAKIKTPNSDDYVLNLKGTVNGIEFAVSADFLNMDICASAQAGEYEILARILDGKAYLTVGEIAVVGSINELSSLIKEIMLIVGADDSQIDLDKIFNSDLSVSDLLGAIAVDVEDSLKVSVNIADVEVVASFDANAEFHSITVNAEGINAVITSGDVRVPALDVNSVYISLELLTKHILAIYNNYKNVLTDGIAAQITTVVNVNGKDYILSAAVNFNDGLYLQANIIDNTTMLAALDMYLVGNALYLDVNGVRVATELNSSASGSNIDFYSVWGLLNKAKGYNDVLDGVIAAVEQLPAKLATVNYLDWLSSLTYNNDVLTAEVKGSQLGLSDFVVTLEGTKNVVVTLQNITIGSVTIGSLTVDAYPACGKVTAPTSEYVTELEVEVMGYDVTVKLDLYNKSVTAKTVLLGHELDIYYFENAAYVKYGAVNAKLNVNDIDKLVDIISSFIDGGIPSVAMPVVDVKQILDSVNITATDDGYEIGLNVSGIALSASFDGNARLVNISANVSNVDVNAKLISGAAYPTFDLDADYVDLVAVAETYANGIREIINAKGYDVNVNGNFDVDGCEYGVRANVVYNGGLYVNANVFYNSANMLNAELWYVDNVLYVSSGDFKLALALNQNAKNGNATIDLSQFKGYNDYIDGVLDVVQNVIDKFVGGNVDYLSLVSGLTTVNGDLLLGVNGEQLGLDAFSLKLIASNGLSAEVTNLVLDKVTANLTANVAASDSVVAAPSGDFSTNLSVKIDDKNTLYVNLDLINNVFNFRLDDLYAMYADGIVKLNKGDMYVSGDVNKIMEYVKRIDDLVNEFSGAAESTIAGIDFDMFKNIDIKAIVKSLAIVSDGGKVTLSGKAFGMDISAIFAYGKLHTIIVPVSQIDKTLEIEPCKKETLGNFNVEESKYVCLDVVLGEYLPTIEQLVHTNSWKFAFDQGGSVMISVKDQTYLVSDSSYVEFYYNNTEGFDTMSLRAKLEILKQNGVDSKGQAVWNAFMKFDAAYIPFVANADGTYSYNKDIYITYTGDHDKSLKFTVSVDSVIKCMQLKDSLIEVVPQIGDLINKMSDAMNEAENNADKMSYANIINDASYVNGVFGLSLNGNALLSKLGEILLSAHADSNSLVLDNLSVNYDGVSVVVTGLRVVTSDVDESYESSKNDAKWYGGMQYAVVQDICSYDTSGHIDFNSIYELLSSFVITAAPAEGSDGARSFYISGTAPVSMNLGAIPLANIKIGVAVKVDIDKDNNVFISAKITRSNQKVLGSSIYDDNGGDSYLNYNSVTGMFTVIRDSKKELSTTHKEDVDEWYYVCTECEKEGRDCENDKKECPTKVGGFLGIGAKPKHDASAMELRCRTLYDQDVPDTALDPENCKEWNLTTQEFTADMLNYIFEMINLNSSGPWFLFGQSIEGLVKDNINNSNSNNEFGIEDIFVSYAYNASASNYNVMIDLSPINSNLTSAELDIYHDQDYKLDRVSGDVYLLGEMCNIKLNLTLKDSVYGEAADIVVNSARW